MVEPILDIRNLSISFSTRAVEIPAVMDFSCQVMPGEAMGLVGESGCGKSTVALAILRDLARIGRITSGSIHFNGRDMAKLSEHELRQIRGSEIAMVYQEPMASLNPTMKIGRQLTEVLFIHEMVTKEHAYARALNMVKAVKLPDPERIMGSYPHQLSGGQQQRIVIAMALLAKPKLLILDEPTTALDVTVEAGIVELVKELGKKFGTSMLFISHNLGLILETCDRVTVMYSGEAVESGPIRDVFGSVRHPYTQGLFRSMPLLSTSRNSRPLIPIPGQLPLPHERPKGCHFGPRCSHFVDGVCNVSAVAMRSIDEANSHHSRCMRVSEIDWHATPEAATQTEAASAGPELLNVKGLKKYYKAAASELFGGRETRTVKAVEEVSFTAREAETLAIVGESGCGKSTLAKVLLGLETATEGTARYDETEIQSDPIERRDTKLISSIQMIFQNPFDTLNPSYSVGSQIIRTLERFGIGASREERSEMMLNLLDLVKLPRAFATRMPRQLSGGQKQRIGVARAFAGHPRMIIADEPMSALDVSVQAAITELLTTIQRQSRTTMILISHDLSLVRYMADRIIVMYLGHIVEQGTAEQIFAPPYHPYTEALLSAIPLADSAAKKRKIVLEGEIPSALSPPSGCPFQSRCHMKSKVSGSLCEQVVPTMRELKDGHAMKCHLPIEILDQMTPVIN
jgi:peptide/nickel transport system ATP-binding protein